MRTDKHLPTSNVGLRPTTCPTTGVGGLPPGDIARSNDAIADWLDAQGMALARRYPDATLAGWDAWAVRDYVRYFIAANLVRQHGTGERRVA